MCVRSIIITSYLTSSPFSWPILLDVSVIRGSRLEGSPICEFFSYTPFIFTSASLRSNRCRKRVKCSHNVHIKRFHSCVGLLQQEDEVFRDHLGYQKKKRGAIFVDVAPDLVKGQNMYNCLSCWFLKHLCDVIMSVPLVLFLLQLFVDMLNLTQQLLLPLFWRQVGEIRFCSRLLQKHTNNAENMDMSTEYYCTCDLKHK